MLLAKNCFKKDNLKSRKTIKLGTLYEYRKIESAQIVDKDEGKYSFLLKFDGEVQLDRRLFGLLFQGIIGLDGDDLLPAIPGGMSAQIVTLDMCEFASDFVTVKDSSAIVHRDAPNSFIFCMSEVRKLRDAVGLFPDYDDCWYMNATSAQLLAGVLARLLRSRIISGRASGDHIIDPNFKSDDLSVYCRHQLVYYLDRSVHISGNSEFTSGHFIKTMRDMAFVKPPSFSKEKEYRYSFTIVVGDKIFVPLVDNVILNAEMLVDWVF